MKKGFIALIVIGVIVLILIFSGVGAYNNLVAQSENVETQLSQIDNQLQRRNDLIPNLVETVKGYAAHEKEIFTNVAEARAKLAGSSTVSDKAEASAELTSALNRLIAIAENYPQLKANQNFIQLSDELAGTENRIANARMGFNEAARDYNTTIRKFPTVILANMFGFDKYDYFEATEGAQNVPEVSF
jgi:LemA protein